MISLLNGLSLCLFVYSISGARGQLPMPPHAMRSLAEQETVLPCRHRGDPGEDVQVVQVTWYKEKPDGNREQMIAAHHTEGQTAFGPWSGRVRFRGSEPTVDSSLVIMSTEVTDEGRYTCHISTFPTGNFEQHLLLTVWTIPISSLDPVVLVEGQSYRMAASCRSVARPLPSLSWDTDLSGQSTNRTSDSGSVSSQYSLHPLRSMNGKRLDCLVWHPALDQPRRLRNSLVVHYPPHAEVSGYGQDWYMGLETAALHCVSGGNPEPHSFTWTRGGGALPQGVIPHTNGTLVFGRPLSLSDAGVYQCVAKNEVGTGKAEVEIKVTEERQKLAGLDGPLLISICAAGGGLLLLMFIIIVSVTCHHRRRNRKLERALTVKDNEISNLVRQASFRKVNSNSGMGDSVEQMEKNSLAAEGLTRMSMSSYGGDQARSRDSHSSLSAGYGGGGGRGEIGLDHLGRPVLHNSSRRMSRAVDRDEENRLRVETLARNNTMSLDRRMQQPLSPFPAVNPTEVLRVRNGSPADSLPGNVGRHRQHSPLGCSYPPPMDEEDEGLGGLMCPENQEQSPDDDDHHHDPEGSETDGSLLWDPQNGPVRPQANGTLRSKTQARNAGVVPNNPHASLIHKAQIV